MILIYVISNENASDNYFKFFNKSIETFENLTVLVDNSTVRICFITTVIKLEHQISILSVRPSVSRNEQALYSIQMSLWEYAQKKMQ